MPCLNLLTFSLNMFPSSVTTGLGKISSSIFLVSPFYILKGQNNASPELTLLQTYFLHRKGVPAFWWSLLWTCCNNSMPFMNCGLQTQIQYWTHMSRIEGENPFPWPAGHASLDAAEDIWLATRLVSTTCPSWRLIEGFGYLKFT